MTFGRSVPSDRSEGIVPLENRTLWERVHEFLREEILADHLQPGTELQEVALAESLGVSRGPVREALGRLSAEGLVTIRPRNGAVVRAFSKDEFIEAYQVRQALETLALELAFPKMAGEELQNLQRLIDQMVIQADAQDVPGFFRANAAFHDSLVQASGNRKLREVHAQLARQIGRYQIRSLALRGDLRRSIEEHREIVQAIRDSDIVQAVLLLKQHIQIPLDRLLAVSDAELQDLGLADPGVRSRLAAATKESKQ